MKELLSNYMQFLAAVRALEGDRRTADAEDFAHRARLRAKEIEGRYLDLDASGDLGDARLADIHDAEAAGLFDPAGWYLGVMERRFLFLNADGHNLIYARTGGGKGTTSALPNLAHCQSSMFVIDVKDAELAKASSVHRALNLGQEVIVLDPWGITGHPSAKVSPLHRLVEIVEVGGEIDAEADEIALILLPPGKADAGDNSWVRKGARRLLSLRMKYLAYEAPHRLVLSELWRFVNASDGQLQAAFADMRGSPREDVAGTAAYMLSVMLEAPKQFEAYRSECIEALGSFSPSSSLARATSENTVKFGAMKDRPITVYLCVPSSKIGVAAPWLAMLLNHAIEEIAAHEGSAKVRFLVDEFAQLPAPIPAVMKALRLYRGRGILMTLYCQGRFSLQDAGYSQAAVKEIEDQAACIQMWGIEDPSLIRDVSYWSGNTSVVQVNPSHNGGQVAQGSMGRGEQKRPVLQVENIRRINDGRQIIKLPGFPLFVADRAPYWKVQPWTHVIEDTRL